jgi:hypothetical protein
MAIQFGTTLTNALLVTSPLQTLLANGSILVFSGTPPTGADDATSGNTLLLTIKNGASGVTWNNTPSNGVLTKTAAETWSGTVGTAGTATFFRYVVGSDAGTAAASAGNYRIQGSVGTDINADLLLATTALAASAVVTLANAQIAMPVFA